MLFGQIQAFIEVARTGNVSRAAEVLYVTQPALTARIQALEKDLGEALFVRGPRGAALTAPGALFLPHAQRIAAEAEEARRRVREGGGKVRGRLVLGVLPTIAPYLLPGLLGSFLRKYREVEVVVQEEITARLIEAVQAGGVDLALLSLPLPGTGLEREAILEEPFLLVLPKAHPLARRKSVPMAALAEEKFILMQEGHCLAAQTLEVCHSRGDFSPNVLCRSAQVQTLLALVRAGLGLSIVPRMAALPDCGLVYRPFPPRAPSRTVGFVWKRQRDWPAPRAFREWARARVE